MTPAEIRAIRARYEVRGADPELLAALDAGAEARAEVERLRQLALERGRKLYDATAMLERVRAWASGGEDDIEDMDHLDGAAYVYGRARATVRVLIGELEAKP